MILTVPIDAELYPTLGPQVVDWAETNLVFGPGDLVGKPLVLDAERRFFIYRMYEVYPQGHHLAGRRRFNRCGLSLQKGSAKTELAAIIAACELHPEAPVRCDGWTPDGEPIGAPVTDPYIPMVATNEAQSDELAYGALRVILEKSKVAGDFDIGLERILRRSGDGKAESLSSNPNARDGARTTFGVFDETHRWVLPRLRSAYNTMLNNLPKRMLAQAWMLEITTAPEPGVGSVAETTMELARQILDGRVRGTSFFFFHRQASDAHDLTTREGAKSAVIEAAGPSAAWRDIDAIVDILDDPGTDRAYWERVWCNRLVQGATQAFDPELWKSLKCEEVVKPGDLITLGFDGSISEDGSGLVGTKVETGYQFKIRAWERPLNAKPDWRVDAGEVDATVRATFATFNVWRLYADPFYWESYVSDWAAEFAIVEGAKRTERVVEWRTNRPPQMSRELAGYRNAMVNKTLSHDGDDQFTRHIANARKQDLHQRDEQGNHLFLIRKDRPKSPNKIDLAMAGCLSWTARLHAVSDGALKAQTKVLSFATVTR